jgi:hypothetical protein
VPTVTKFNNITYTLSLNSDPLAGPYTTTVYTTPDSAVNIRINQVTAGPLSNINVTFGDGSPVQTYNNIISSFNITKIYSTPGTYTIVATPYGLSVPNASIAITVNTMTVKVAQHAYPSNLKKIIFVI